MKEQNSQSLKRLLIITGVLLIVHLCSLLFPGLFQWADTRVYTLFFRIRQFIQGKQQVSPYLLLLNLDDKFEKKYNTPGMEREKMAEVLENIRAVGARTILVDIIYRQRGTTLEDEILVQATRTSGNIFYPFIIHRNQYPGETLPEFLSEKALWPLNVTRKGQPLKVGLGITPFPELCREARGLGGITLLPGSDGIVHRVPLVYSFQGKFVPSLVLAGICHYFQVMPASVSIAFGKHIVLPEATLPGGSVKDIVIPVDTRGQLIVNFTGPWKESVTSFSLENLLSSGKETGGIMKASPTSAPAGLVVIGDITTTSKDLTRGMFDENYPMVGILHNSLNTILTEKYLHQPGAAEKIIISLLVLIILYLIDFLRKEATRPSLLLVLFCIYLVITYGLFILRGRLPDISLHLLAFILSGIIIFRLELREIKKIMVCDDALEVPDVSTVDNSLKPEIQIVKTGEQQPVLTKHLEKLGLSKTQIEVAVLLIKGLQYKEIGYQLGISTTATGRRINRIYKRFGINNKIEFINIVTDNTLLAPPAI